MERAGYRCQRCGATLLLEVHHLDGNPRNNRAENLRVLCDGCHLEAHRQPPPLAA
jgi:5-methylcytosine-specific restriction endonuclease McrA